MKNVTCFTANLSGGGAEHQMSILANFLVDKGYEVTIVTYNDLPDHYKLAPAIKRIRLNVDNKNSLVKQWIISYFFLRHNTDCIISYRSVPNFILLLTLFFKRSPRVIVSERNTTIIPSFKEKINYRLLYNRANVVVPNSYTQEKYLKSLNRLWSKRVTTITNYTDINEFVPKAIPTDTDCIVIGVFSRIFPQKNYERFCQMLHILKKKTEKKFVVYWYGDKKDGAFIKGSLHIHQLVEEYNISDVLVIKDAVKDVSALMGCFHAMCLPSLYEGFSNAISEYICCGKAVICSDVSDNSLMIHEGVNGYLFDPTNVESMCEAFVRFFRLEYNEIVKMGEESRRIAEILFDKDKFVKSYINLIECTE